MHLGLDTLDKLDTEHLLKELYKPTYFSGSMLVQNVSVSRHARFGGLVEGESECIQ